MQSRNHGGRVVVEVPDTGVSFKPKAAERIFAVFEQGSRDVTMRFDGFGLGLAIAEASVKAHGGHISAMSDGPATGATFTVDLPLDEAGCRRGFSTSFFADGRCRGMSLAASVAGPAVPFHHRRL